MGYFVFGAKVGYLCAGEFCSVVRGDSVGESEDAHYVLSEKLDNLLLVDFGEWYCLNPFGKIVCGASRNHS